MNGDQPRELNFQLGIQYNVASHYTQGHTWLELSLAGKKPRPLIYAAFEFRLGLELAAIELLAHIRGKDADTADHAASRKLSQLVNHIWHLVGNQRVLDRKLAFTRIIVDAAGAGHLAIANVDLRRIKSHWESMSNLCHPAFAWADDAFGLLVYQELLGVDAFLADLASKFIVWPRYNDSWLATLSDQFVAGEVDETAARAEIARHGLWGTVTTPEGAKQFASDFAKPDIPQMPAAEL